MTGEEGHVTSLTSWRAACDISARSFGLPTKYERPIRAKFGQLLSVLIALGQGKEVYFDYLGFCLLVLVILWCIIVTCNCLSYFEVGLNYIDLKITEFWACLLFLL